MSLQALQLLIPALVGQYPQETYIPLDDSLKTAHTRPIGQDEPTDEEVARQQIGFTYVVPRGTKP